MPRFSVPIHVKVLAYAASFVALLVLLATITTARLVQIDKLTESLGDHWIVELGMLQAIDHNLTAFRTTEIVRAGTTAGEQRVRAEAEADRYRAEIDDLLARYVHERPQVSIGGFARVWTEYVRAHSDWATGQSELQSEWEVANAELALHFEAAHSAIDAIIEQALEHGSSGTENTDELVDNTIMLSVAISVVAILVAFWASLRVRRNVTAPLAAITHVMSRLAHGDRDVTVPELNRTDEIGRLAKAFDIFRANAIALENAHEATRSAQEHAQALARHDALTGLPNRRVFASELREALSPSSADAVRVSVLMIDLDRFKPVNDLFGHGVGDLLLCEVARRLREAVRKVDTVARLGGDEFAIICREEERSFPTETIAIAQRILGVLSGPMRVGTDTVEIGASIGIATYPDGGTKVPDQLDGPDPDELLRAADIAMYDAKRGGRGTFRFFAKSMDADLRARAALESDLRVAVAEGCIKPYYQPLVSIPDGTVYGFEVLARWSHTERGFVSPDVFIPLAEQLGLIADLTWQVLRQACRQAANWPKDIRLSVNISPIHLKDPSLPTRLLTILNQEGIAPDRLEVEVTESALVSDIDGAKLILSALQAVGIKVALDDFGTGYSSLYHLRELKFDKVKIDRSFVQQMEQSDQSRQIVDAIIGLARNLQLPTIAEGVEDQAIMDHLTSKGCEFAQGYFFGKPMDGHQASKLLNAESLVPALAS
jgi:diguanylate cyclase (GGDEF)-like protein